MELIPDFIYLNSGELNWNAISTISNSILVLSLVLVTIFYASEVKKQTNLMKKANKRIIVLDWTNNFLYPCLNHMKRYVQNINDNEFYWNQPKGKSQISHILKITDSEYGKCLAKADVFKKYPDLENLCLEYDELHDEIIKVNDKIRITIEKTANINCLNRWVNKFMDETQINLDDAKPDPVKYFIQTFVNYKYYKKYDSGDENKVKFIRFDEKIIDCIKTTEYEKLDEVRDGKLDKLKEKISDIEKKVEGILGSFRQEYSISENEMKKQ